MRTGSHVLSSGRLQASWGARVAVTLALAAASTSCGQLQRQGQGSSYLIVDALGAAPGDTPTQFGGTLSSDTVTVVNGVPTIFNDLGQVSFSLAMKDPGSQSSPTQPTSANFITLTRYHVAFVRTDGRNVQGVDVPYAFDGGMTLTVSGSGDQGVFTLVRNIAKDEAPLKALSVNGVILSTIAEVTFYGHDQTGREVSAVARISIDFGNFGDKTS